MLWAPQKKQTGKFWVHNLTLEFIQNSFRLFFPGIDKVFRLKKRKMKLESKRLKGINRNFLSGRTYRVISCI